MKIGIRSHGHHLELDDHMIWAKKINWFDGRSALIVIYDIPIGLYLIRYKFARRFTGWGILFFNIKILV